MRVSNQIDILVVDDNSPDGTGPFLDEWAAREPRLRLGAVHRYAREDADALVADLGGELGQEHGQRVGRDRCVAPEVELHPRRAHDAARGRRGSVGIVQYAPALVP